jgi:hypothetical protein
VLVASGLFILTALVLLIAGLQSAAVGQVYLSIAASLVAAGLLAVGVRQRRPGAGGSDVDDRAP